LKNTPHISFRQFHLFQILNQFEKDSLPLDRFLNQYFRSHIALGSNDRKFISETVYGIVRWQLLLDNLGPDRPTAETRYAIFQGFQPSNFLSVNSIEPHIRVSFPKELFDLLKANFGEEKALYLCQISNTKAPLCIRVNPLKTTRPELLQTLQTKFPVYNTVKSSLGIQFKERSSLMQLPEYQEGHFEIQDEASQLVSSLIPVKPGDQVLDYCAGAGGKTLGFAHKMESRGQIYLHDIRPHILLQAKKRIKRAGIQNVQYLPPSHSQLRKLKKRVDCVVADVPCSGTGTLRRNPDQKWRFTLSMLEKLIKSQRIIFQEALSYVKPGGSIVYATCSLLKEENEEQIAYFLKNYPLTLEGDIFCSHPTFEGMDGFFAAVLKKIS